MKKEKEKKATATIGRQVVEGYVDRKGHEVISSTSVGRTIFFLGFSTLLENSFIIQVGLSFLAVFMTVPSFVSAHTFCASRDSRVSCGWRLLIQGYFCAV